MLVQTWTDVLIQSFQDLWAKFVYFSFAFVFALIVFAIGWIVGNILGELAKKLSDALRLDSVLDKMGIKEVAERGGIKLSIGEFFRVLVKVFVIAVFLLASLDIVGLSQVSVFLQTTVLFFIPKLIVAVLMLIIAAIIAEFLRDVVVGAARTAGVKGAGFIGALTKWSIWTFAMLVALSELGVAVAFLQTLFAGIIIAFALAFGLAFGLGGKEVAARVLEKLEKELSHKEK